MNLHNVPSHRDTEAVETAKKAIEAIRNGTFSNKATAGDKTSEKRHQPFHPRVDTERKVESKELTKKAIENICCNFSSKKSTPTGKVGDNIHRPLYPNVVGEEKKAGASTEATVEAYCQSEANLTTLKGVSIITSTCECCSEGSIEVNHLVRIDSGQLLCPDCLKALREAISKNGIIEYN